MEDRIRHAREALQDTKAWNSRVNVYEQTIKAEKAEERKTGIREFKHVTASTDLVAFKNRTALDHEGFFGKSHQAHTRDGEEALYVHSFRDAPRPECASPLRHVAKPVKNANFAEKITEIDGTNVAWRHDEAVLILEAHVDKKTNLINMAVPPSALKAITMVSAQRRPPRAARIIPTKRELVLAEQFFEEGAILWCVLAMHFDRERQAPVVYYYDHGEGEKEGIKREQLQGNLSHRLVECSLVTEAINWTKVRWTQQWIHDSAHHLKICLRTSKRNAKP